jgi:hypothetical protein
MHKSSIISAQSYAAQRGLEIAERLGSGKDGIVFVAKRKVTPARVAIKAHKFTELYLREKLAYERLKETGTSLISGFNVPQIVSADDDLRIIGNDHCRKTVRTDFAAPALTIAPNSRPRSGQSGKSKSASNSRSVGP